MSSLIHKIVSNPTTRLLFIIYLFILLLSVYFISSTYFNDIKLNEKIQFAKLEALVSTSAVLIDGDLHEELMGKYLEKDAITKIYDDSLYLKLQTCLKKIHQSNQLSSTLYTLVFNPTTNNFLYVVRSDDQVYFRHEYVQYPQILKIKYKTGGIVPRYKSENGEWLSAFKSIKNRNGRVVGIIEADSEFTSFKNAVIKEFLINTSISLVVILLLTFMMLYFVRSILRKEELYKAKILHQKNTIEQKNWHIEQSIIYAKRIQIAIFPKLIELTNYIPNSFIFLKPKDVVSGDFYWFKSFENKKIIAVGDCTGHGVPGALMSTLAHNALNNSETGSKSPSQILEQLDLNIVKALHQEDQSANKDGLDMAMCIIDETKQTIEFSGALRPLFLIRNHEIKIYSGDRNSIGGINYDVNKSFTNHIIEFQKGDSIYMFTDGYPDQFGGEGDKKFTIKQFKKLLLSIQNNTMEKQRGLISEAFRKWKGNYSQTDDVLVIGFKL